MVSNNLSVNVHWMQLSFVVSMDEHVRYGVFGSPLQLQSPIEYSNHPHTGSFDRSSLDMKSDLFASENPPIASEVSYLW